MPRIVEVDASLSKSPGAFFLIAVEVANMREGRLEIIFRRSKPSHEMGCDKNIPRGFAMTGSKSYTACYPAL